MIVLQNDMLTPEAWLPSLYMGVKSCIFNGILLKAKNWQQPESWTSLYVKDKKATLKVKIIETQKHKQVYARRGDHLVWNQGFKLSWVLSISSQDYSITFLGK